MRQKPPKTPKLLDSLILTANFCSNMITGSIGQPARHAGGATGCSDEKPMVSFVFGFSAPVAVPGRICVLTAK